MSNIIGEGSFSLGNPGEAEVQPRELLNHFFGVNNSLYMKRGNNSNLHKLRRKEANQDIRVMPDRYFFIKSMFFLMELKLFIFRFVR